MNKLLKSAQYVLKTEGINGVWWKVRRFIAPSFVNSKIYKKHKIKFINKTALEIGGPSSIFGNKNIFPIYDVLNVVDGCNYNVDTVWEGQIIEGLGNYKYSNSFNGTQYVCEASDLSNLPNHSYDIILSCHSLEHIANPLKALEGWMRVLKPNGYILLILPHPKFTFDHKRPVTSFVHLLDDYNNNIDETNLSCLDEVLALHDLERDPLGPKTFEEFKKRSLDNYKNRCLHQHVFSIDLVEEMFQFSNIKLLESEFVRSCNLIFLGQKN